MSVTKEVTIWCDAADCSEWAQFNSPESAGGQAMVARRILRTQGWRSRAGLDYCPREKA